jgi:hypothetical protein
MGQAAWSAALTAAFLAVLGSGAELRSPQGGASALAQGAATSGAAAGGTAVSGAAAGDASKDSGGAAARDAAKGAPEAMPREGGDKLPWGADFAQWTRVTGYLFSRNHGQRLATIRVTPSASAEVRMANAEWIRQLRNDRLKKYPVGTSISMQTWELGADLNRGEPGPLFFMRKEAPGYDPEGGDWRYAMTRPDLSVLGEGKDGKVTLCRTCHLTQKERDYVPAQDR